MRFIFAGHIFSLGYSNDLADFYSFSRLIGLNCNLVLTQLFIYFFSLSLSTDKIFPWPDLETAPVSDEDPESGIVSI